VFDPLSNTNEAKPGEPRVAALQLRTAVGRFAARVTWPPPAPDPPPLAVYFADATAPARSEAVARVLCGEAGVVVVAPACRSLHGAYWSSFCDAATALEWTADHAAELDADAGRLVVAGYGAGGRLAAALALYAHDQGWPPLARQVLICPQLDVGPDADGRYVSPLRVVLNGAVPATVLTSRHTTLRDDGGRYAHRLRQAGVDVEHLQGDAASERALSALARALRGQLAPRTGDPPVPRPPGSPAPTEQKDPMSQTTRHSPRAAGRERLGPADARCPAVSDEFRRDAQSLPPDPDREEPRDDR
jgi:acetyl esterase/lipase